MSRRLAVWPDGQCSTTSLRLKGRLLLMRRRRKRGDETVESYDAPRAVMASMVERCASRSALLAASGGGRRHLVRGIIGAKHRDVGKQYVGRSASARVSVVATGPDAHNPHHRRTGTAT
jgi:hypothetical protein